ncbi:CLUMA_CG006914, isoform A [Clunio marinus]|uniref:CLUMA_CG006914, isoform A n=1 Tax=Clunio marinus TaxID=568069 RepID=A0A1J1I0T2_9DIPT|nr:CLUMA_CG006914, isoform A [Clunio marinus]
MHLRHKLPWDDLVFCLRIDPSTINLPIGECGRIHMIDKATKIKVKNRNYISNEDICTAQDCKKVESYKSFSKNKVSHPIITTSGFRTPRNEDVERKLKYFNEKFYEAILEFVETEEKKYSEENIRNFRPRESFQGIPTDCEESDWNYLKNSFYNNNNDFMVFYLYSNYRIDHLLWLEQKGELNISEALSKTYGGQAVGNGYNFLVIYHLLPFYLLTNAIIACGYESDYKKWGRLDPDCHFLQRLMYDCDFLTFIPSLRPFLHKDVFIKDATKTNELLKIIFRNIYLFVFLKRKFCSYDDEAFRNDFKASRWFSFK